MNLRGSAPVFAALGDETRLQLLSRLCDRGPMSIAQLAFGSQVTRQAITKHLRTMERAGLVRGSRRGREMIWKIEKERPKLAGGSLDRIASEWDHALDRLRTLVEE